MKRLIILLVLLAIALTGPAAYAGKKNTGLDMARYKCRDLMNETDDDAAVVLMWVDGYMSCRTGDLRLDMQWIEELATALATTCSRYPNKYLIDVVEDLASN